VLRKIFKPNYVIYTSHLV